MRRSASGSASFARLLQYRPRLWSPPTICTDFPFTVRRTESFSRSTAPTFSTTDASVGCENGSRVTSTSWFPRTAKTPRRGSSAATAASSRGSPRRRERRSPVIATMSHGVSDAQRTARSSARPLNEIVPRWKSDRWTIVSPSSSGGRPGSSTSRRWNSTHWDSKSDQPRTPAAAAAAPATAAARRTTRYPPCERMLSRSRARAASISRRSCSVRSRPPFVSGPPRLRMRPNTTAAAAARAATAATRRRNLRTIGAILGNRAPAWPSSGLRGTRPEMPLR